LRSSSVVLKEAESGDQNSVRQWWRNCKVSDKACDDQGVISAEIIADLEAREFPYILGVRERSDELMRHPPESLSNSRIALNRSGTVHHAKPICRTLSHSVAWEMLNG
jgi:hypothetical protein